MHTRPPTAVCWKSTNKSLDSAVTGRYCAVIEIKSHIHMMTSRINHLSVPIQELRYLAKCDSSNILPLPSTVDEKYVPGILPTPRESDETVS